MNKSLTVVSFNGIPADCSWLHRLAINLGHFITKFILSVTVAAPKRGNRISITSAT